MAESLFFGFRVHNVHTDAVVVLILDGNVYSIILFENFATLGSE